MVGMFMLDTHSDGIEAPITVYICEISRTSLLLVACDLGSRSLPVVLPMFLQTVLLVFRVLVAYWDHRQYCQQRATNDRGTHYCQKEELVAY